MVSLSVVSRAYHAEGWKPPLNDYVFSKGRMPLCRFFLSTSITT